MQDSSMVVEEKVNKWITDMKLNCAAPFIFTMHIRHSLHNIELKLTILHFQHLGNVAVILHRLHGHGCGKVRVLMLLCVKSIQRRSKDCIWTSARSNDGWGVPVVAEGLKKKKTRYPD